MSTFHKLEVLRITNLTPNAVAVTFGIPNELKNGFAFVPGQYITIKHMHNGQELRRAYSISSTPGTADITIGIKKVAGGTFSVYANTVLKKGDFLEIMPPEGRFTYSGEPQNIIAFAAGSGITPIMSIVKSALLQNTETKVGLVFGNRSLEETMFHEELKMLQEKNTDRFKLQHVFSRSEEPDSMFGRIDRSTVNFVLKNRFQDISAPIFYICGPLPMIEIIRDTLLEKGISEDRIFMELFTEPEAEDTMAEVLEGQTLLEVTLDDEVHTLTMDQKNIVLDEVLKEKIDAPYSCQGGVCSTCIARVTEGEARMVKNQILTDSEIREGLILTCQAHPLSPVLKINYDDV